jgi:hypothetical protein
MLQAIQVILAEAAERLPIDLGDGGLAGVGEQLGVFLIRHHAEFA